MKTDNPDAWDYALAPGRGHRDRDRLGVQCFELMYHRYIPGRPNVWKLRFISIKTAAKRNEKWAALLQKWGQEP